ncbi:MAG: HRDC domain-containing protein, partial [Acidimicrobiales bacterium]
GWRAGGPAGVGRSGGERAGGGRGGSRARERGGKGSHPRRRPAGDEPAESGNGSVGPVAEALRAWRRDQASRDGVPAYVVMSDAHLLGIAGRGPSSMAELARCKGMGPVRLERYGDDILAVIERART